jgi:hypothetical protein
MSGTWLSQIGGTTQFVWLARAGTRPLEATLATIEGYKREPLLDGKAPAPSTMARRVACVSHFYRYLPGRQVGLCARKR